MSRSYSRLAGPVGMAGAAAAGSAVAFTDVHQVWHAVMGVIPTSESVRHAVAGFGMAFALTLAGAVAGSVAVFLPGRRFGRLRGATLGVVLASGTTGGSAVLLMAGSGFRSWLRAAGTISAAG